eukprot:GHVS01072880.1.p1 GENE.GHVS01072880.1~~GHVS01072880.1.p1  ORF type:complete len:256 (+),score=32.20 GHVS01072880.1:176-943(+)
MGLRSPLLFLLLSLLLCCLSVSADFSDDDEELPIEAKGLWLFYPDGTDSETCGVFKRHSYEASLAYVDIIFNKTNNPACMLVGDQQRLDILKKVKFRDLEGRVTVTAMEDDEGNHGIAHFVQFMPIAGKSPESRLTIKQEEFFINFDRNLEVMAEVIGYGKPMSSEFMEKSNELFDRQLPLLDSGHLEGLHGIFFNEEKKPAATKTATKISSAFSLHRIPSTSTSDVLSQFVSLLFPAPSLLAIGSFVLTFVLSV